MNEYDFFFYIYFIIRSFILIMEKLFKKMIIRTCHVSNKSTTSRMYVHVFKIMSRALLYA